MKYPRPSEQTPEASFYIHRMPPITLEPVGVLGSYTDLGVTPEYTPWPGANTWRGIVTSLRHEDGKHPQYTFGIVGGLARMHSEIALTCGLDAQVEQLVDPAVDSHAFLTLEMSERERELRVQLMYAPGIQVVSTKILELAVSLLEVGTQIPSPFEQPHEQYGVSIGHIYPYVCSAMRNEGGSITITPSWQYP